MSKPTASHLFKNAETGFGTWSSTPLFQRAEILLNFAKELEKQKDKVAQTISREMGKPLWESRTEVQSALNKAQISIESFRMRCPENIRALPQGRSITRHRPHGIALVLGPYNFPLHLPNGHIIPALLAGNAIIFKPSEYTPDTAALYASIWAKANLPKHVLQIAPADLKTATALLDEPFNLVLFTGSLRVGKILLEKFSSRPEVILALEMGGNNPLVIGEISDFHAASYHTIQSTFLTSGQRCTSVRRLIVPEGVKGETFLKELIQMTSKIKFGTWDEKIEPFMGPLVSDKAADKVVQVYNTLIEQGGKILYPLTQDPINRALLSPGIIDVTSVENRVDEEIFGPLLQVIRVKDFEAAIQEANRTRFGLSAGIFSDSEEEYATFFEKIKAGIINWNVPLTGASSYAPFGGVGLSGNGRPSALYAADYTAYPVASIESSHLTIPSPLPPGLQGVKP